MSARALPPRNEPIAIIGSACRFPGPATNPSKLWEFLKDPHDIATDVPKNRFDLHGFYHPDPKQHGTFSMRTSYFLQHDHRHFDAAFFNIHPREAETMDPQQRILLETVYETLESAGTTIENMQGSQTSVYVGGMAYDFRDSLFVRDPASIPEYAASGAHASILSARISYFFDWKGPCMSIDTACSSSLVAVHQAVQSLRNGDSTTAVAAGSNLIAGPELFIALSNLQVLSPTGSCKMWDAAADGYARGEGFGAVLLKPLSRAIADGDNIQSVIRETGVSHDGKTTGITMPSAQAQTDLIRRTYERAGLDLTREQDRPQYFEAHGTGTQAGDPIEAQAIHDAFYDAQGLRGSPLNRTAAPHQMYVGSIKTAVGHLEGGAGIAGLLKASLALQHRMIPPNLHFQRLNQKIQPWSQNLIVPTTCLDWPSVGPNTPRRVSINSFGFGGTNAHAILESYDAETDLFAASTPSNKNLRVVTPLLLSAKSEVSLSRLLVDLASWVRSHPAGNLEGLNRTFQKHRSKFGHRKSLAFSSRDHLLQMLEAETNNPPVTTKATQPRLLGVFTGQGAQSACMGEELILHSEKARRTMDHLEASLSSLPDGPSFSMQAELLQPEILSRTGEAELSQPLCTALQIILVDHLRAAGVQFDTIVGHSSGEMAAAYAAGLISSWDAIRVAYYRGRHAPLAQGSSGQKGGMVAVGMSFDDASNFCAQQQFKDRLTVAASNAPSSCTLSGDEDAIGEAIEVLSPTTFTRKLLVDTAYHSHHMQASAEACLKSLERCKIKALEGRKDCHWISTAYESGQHGDISAQHWIDNLTSPVRFSQALSKALLDHGPFNVALEVGPHPALKGPVMEVYSSLQTDDSTLPYAGLLARKQSSALTMASAMGTVWESCPHLKLDFDKHREAWFGTEFSQPAIIYDIPPYPWDHSQIYHRESRHSYRLLSQTTPPHDILGSRMPTESDDHLRFRKIVSLKAVPWLEGYKIQNSCVLPSMWYAVAVLEAAKILDKGRDTVATEITDFHIHQPTPIDDSDSVEMLLDLRTGEACTNPDELTAVVECFTGSIFNPDPHRKSFTAQVHLYFQKQGPLEPSISICGAMTRDVKQFYADLAEAGISQTGSFKSLLSIRQAKDVTETEVAQRPCSHDLHPITLDQSIHSLLVPYYRPNDGYQKALFIPKRIGRMIFDMQALAVASQCNDTIKCRASLVKASHEAMNGTIELFVNSKQAVAVLEEVTFASITQISEASERKLFAKTIWRPDILHGPVVAVAEYDASEQTLVSACDRVAWYYYRQLRDTIQPNELEQAEWHFRKAFKFIEHILPMFAQGEIPTVDPTWIHDTRTQIEQVFASHPDSPDLRIINVVGENLPQAMREKRSMLEFMMVDDRLSEYYEQAMGYQKCYEMLRMMISRIVHRHPRMSILEVGAGTGGATQHVFDALENRFKSYTFSDISSGFFEKAQESFQYNAHRMTFKTFDLERDALQQGFEPASYDLIIGSLVVHATQDLRLTLRNVRALLRPGGYLTLVEGSEDVVRTGFIMSGLPGWWLGGDDRPWGPMISPERWNEVLQQTGFSAIDVLATDSKLPWTSHGIVFTCQAIDDRVTILREPLTPQPSSDDVCIIGGQHGLADDIEKSIGKACNKVSRSADLLSATQIRGQHILCLSELDQPIFGDMEDAKLEALKKLFSACGHILFVLRENEPHSAALMGLIRSLRLEMSNLKVQVLLFEGRDVDSKAISETFMSLIRLPEKEDNLMWTFEPELKWFDHSFYIPRVVYDVRRNHRLNSNRRRITEAVNPSTSPVEFSGQSILSSTQSSCSSMDQQRPALATTVSPLKIGCSRKFLSICQNQRSNTASLMLSSSLTSMVRNDSTICADLQMQDQDYGIVLHAVNARLVAQRIFCSVDPGDCLLIHGANLTLRNALADANGDECRLIFTSSECDSGSDDLIHINSTMTKAQIRKKVQAHRVDRVVIMETDRIEILLQRAYPEIQRLETSMLRGVTVNDVSRAAAWAKNQMPTLKDTKERILSPTEVSRADTQRINLRVVDWTSATTLEVPIRPICSTYAFFRNDRLYMLLGLTGTMGRSLCEWMIRQGARHVVMTSRNPQVDTAWLDQMRSLSANVEVLPLDICNLPALKALVDDLERRFPPIGGVVNGAMILQDSAFQNMTSKEMATCLAPKVTGSKNLDDVFCETPLEFFILISSIAYVVGNPGQSNYSAANGFMVALAKQRRARGLAASAMSIGAQADVGYLSRTKADKVGNFARQKNMMAISEEELQTTFAEAILAGKPWSDSDGEVVTGLDGTIDSRQTTMEDLPSWLRNPRVSQLIVDRGDQAQQSQTSTQRTVSLKDQLKQSTSGKDSLAFIVEAFVSKVERMLLIETGRVQPSSSLIELGVDSLIAVEIRSFFKKELDIDVPTLKILGGASISDIAELIMSLSSGGPVPAEERTATTNDADSAYETGSSVDSPAPKTTREVLSYAQTRLFLVDAKDKSSRVNNMSFALRLDGEVDTARLSRAFDEAASVPESLRTRFYQSGDQLFQEVMDTPGVRLEMIKAKSDEEMDAIFHELDETLFDLAAGRTMRAALCTLSDRVHAIMFAFHHILVDTTSCEMLLANINQAYEGKPLKRPQHELQDYARYERTSLATGAWDESLAYWRAQHDAPTATRLLPLLPFARVQHRQAMQTYRLRSLTTSLAPSTTRAIKALCADLKIAPYHFHLATFAALLHALYPTLNGDLCVGAVDTGRGASLAHADVFGPLFNYLPLRVRVRASPDNSEMLPFASHARAMRNIAYAAAAHAHVPFDAVLAALHPPLQPLPETHHPLYQAQINYLAHNLEHLSLGTGESEIPMTQRNVSGVEISYDVCLTVLENPRGGARFTIHLQEYLYGPGALRWLAGLYARLLEGFVHEPWRDVLRLEVAVPGPEVEVEDGSGAGV